MNGFTLAHGWIGAMGNFLPDYPTHVFAVCPECKGKDPGPFQVEHAREIIERFPLPPPI
jgi:hypothetical protein